jgi:hypothetical protein
LYDTVSTLKPIAAMSATCYTNLGPNSYASEMNAAADVLLAEEQRFEQLEGPARRMATMMNSISASRPGIRERAYLV